MKLNQQDVAAGSIFIAIGAWFAYSALQLELGTPLRMGPGFFPLALAIILIALGIAISLRSFVDDLEPLAFVPLRSLALILLPPILFGATVRGLGLVPSLAMVVFMAGFASRRMTLPFAFGLTLGLTAFCVAVFYYALGLTLPLFGPWIGG